MLANKDFIALKAKNPLLFDENKRLDFDQEVWDNFYKTHKTSSNANVDVMIKFLEQVIK